MTAAVIIGLCGLIALLPKVIPGLYRPILAICSFAFPVAIVMTPRAYVNWNMWYWPEVVLGLLFANFLLRVLYRRQQRVAQYEFGSNETAM